MRDERRRDNLHSTKEEGKESGMKTTKMTMTAAKVDQEIKPGELISATLSKAGNGGCTVSWNHSPQEPKGKSDYPRYVEHRPDAFGSIEEACHAMAQAFGGASELEYEKADAAEDAADGKKGKAA